jgi:hypothetical protein
MTLSAMVKTFCANQRDGRCIMSSKPCPVLSKAKCSVPARWWVGSHYGEDTDYFTSCVIPLANKQPELTSAANEYAEICGSAKRLSERRCECGEPIAARMRCCENCRRKRARATQRAWRAAR